MPPKDSRDAAEARTGTESLGGAEILDLRGLKCPLPALFTKKRLAHAQIGETITVLTDDPLAVVDIPHMCAQEGYEHVCSTNNDGVRHVTVRRRS
ncbi:MAG TPA: sulfurtransferase TusA family protein [Rhizomicrobium sp.]|jgi:tRNA 2-thiouridine synthesizing protein A